MEIPSASKCAIAAGRNDHGDSVCDGIGVDDQWKYPRVFEEISECRPVGSCEFSTQGPVVFAPSLLTVR